MKVLDAFPKHRVYRGKIYSPLGRELLGSINKTNGYRVVSLRYKGKRKNASYARIICEHYRGPCPKGYDCLHKDGNKLNNTPTNLRWGTRADNEADKVLHGRSNRGERCGTSKLTQVEVNRILGLQGRAKASTVALEYGVIPRTIRNIWNGHTWRAR